MPDADTSTIARLIVVSERDHRFVDLADQEIGVGRAPENAIVVKDDMVSRRHCVIERAAKGGWRVRDLKSFNGTYLNGERVNDEPLHPWDSVRVGRTRIFYVESGGQGGALAPPPVSKPEDGVPAPAAPAEAENMGLTKQMALGGNTPEGRLTALLADPGVRGAIEESIRRERTEVERQVARRLRDESAPASTPVAAGMSVRARRLGPLDGGGDFYDVFVDERDPDSLIVGVGTVSGQGIAASIAGSAARHALRGVVLSGTGDVVERLARLRDVLAKTLHPGTSVSLALARGVSGGRVRIGAVGGAGALLLRSSKSEVEGLRGIGRRDEGANRLESVEVDLEPGDRLLIASDGAGSIRAPGGGEPFGETRLRQAFVGGATLGPSEALARVVDGLVAHAGGTADRDATAVLVVRG
jgi:hypothetical protein